MITSSLYAGSLGGAQPAPNMTIQPYTGGLAAPAPQQVAPPPPTRDFSAPMKASDAAGLVQYAGSNPGGWFSGTGYDPSNPLNGINNITGLNFYGAKDATMNGADSWDPATSAYTIGSNGQALDLSGDAKSGYTFNTSYDNPSGKSEKDKVGVTYSYDPATGTAEPISSNAYYAPSDWVSTYRPVAQILGTVLGVGFGGAAALGALEGGGAGAGAAATEAGAAGGTSLGGDAAATSLGGGFDFGAGTGATFGGTGGGTLAGSSALGSGIAGSGASDLAAAYQSLAGAAAGSGSLGSTLKDVVKSATSGSKGSQTGGNLLGVLGMGSSGLTAGDRYRQQLLAQSLRDNVQTPAQTLPGWIPGAS